MIRRPPRSTLFPLHDALPILPPVPTPATKCVTRPSVWRQISGRVTDRKSTRLNSSHVSISYAVFCLKKKKKEKKMNARKDAITVTEDGHMTAYRCHTDVYDPI